MKISDLDENGKMIWSVCQICGKKLEFSRLNNHKIRLHKT